MNKPLSITALVLIFIGLVFGSYAMWDEMKMGRTASQGEEVENKASVVVEVPEPQALVTSPLTVKGEARGTWFFEASFPIDVVDGNGTVLGTGIAQAQGDWMTEDYVPFMATVTFTAPGTADGFIFLKKDNPSGLPENDAAIAVPVTFE